MAGTRQSLISWLTRVIRRPSFWLIVALFVLITLPHYEEAFRYPAFLTYIIGNIGLTRHALERILYLVPIVWAGFLFGFRGTAITSLAALACMLPRAVFISPSPLDAISEMSAVVLAGSFISGLLASSARLLRRERQYLAHLAALNQTSSVVSQSLDLSQILNSSIDNVMDVMKADAALVFLLDEEAGELILTAHQGVSSEFAQGVDKLKLGEGFNGMVAKTGEPLFVEDAAQDPRLTKMVVMGCPHY